METTEDDLADGERYKTADGVDTATATEIFKGAAERTRKTMKLFIPIIVNIWGEENFNSLI